MVSWLDGQKRLKIKTHYAVKGTGNQESIIVNH
jgi:hypothetical protein